MNNEELIQTFYTAFSNRDSQSMVDCYHEEIEFEDPAFGTLTGHRAKAMWTMLCKNATDLEIEFSNVKADDLKGFANWKATYTFSVTGRKVINTIQAQFEFKDGKIINHKDHFNLHKWSSQALGLKGWLLGNTAYFRKKLQAQTNRSLDKFISNN